MSKFWTFFLRTIQLICAAVVLALSICAVRWQYRNSVPATNAFVTFAGAFGCLVALLGFAAVVIDVLAGIFMLAHDILATIFLLAGGIVGFTFAIGLQTKLTSYRLTQLVSVESTATTLTTPIPGSTD